MGNDGGSHRRQAYIVAREGWVFIILFGVVAGPFFLAGLWPVGILFSLLALFTVWFFRNPSRIVTVGENMVISPADGKVVEVVELSINRHTNGPAKKVGIFMSVLNVHVNRVPVAGRVTDVRYHPGKFFAATMDKASDLNEQNAVFIDTGRTLPVAVVQIAGLIARRIVCYLNKDETVGCGQRLGLIRFGSRVDLYLPPESSVHVSVGDKVRAGVTIIGRL